MGGIQPRSCHRLTLAAVAAVGVGISTILALNFSNTQIAVTRHQLRVETSAFADDLEQYLQNRELIAKTVGTVFEAPALSEPHPLGATGKKVLALVPEIRVIGWIPQVDPSRIHEVLNALAAAGQPPRLYGPNFETLDVTGARRMLYPVVDVESKSDTRKVGLGMEVGLFPSRKAAFEQARDERRVIATAPVELLQPLNTKGYILYSPVYKERGFVGCLVFTFGVDQLLHGFAQGRRIPMNFRVYDATDPSQLIVGVTRQGEIEAVNTSVRSDGAEAIRQTLDFAGRKMLVSFHPGPDLVQVGVQQPLTVAAGPGLVQGGLQQALMVGSLGLLLTGMVLGGMYYFMRSARRLAFEIATTKIGRASC